MSKTDICLYAHTPLSDHLSAARLHSKQHFAVSLMRVAAPTLCCGLQGGKAILHVIDGVLIPKSLVEKLNLTSLPGATAEPGAEGAGAAKSKATKGEGATPGSSPAPKAKSSAAMAATTLLAPALLALLVL